MLLALKMEEGAVIQGGRRLLKSGKGKNMDPSPEPPQRNAALLTPLP